MPGPGLLLLMACGPPTGAAPDSESVEETAQETAQETAEDTAGPCPEGMAAVTLSDGTLSFCIDRYELVFTGERGSQDQTAEDAVAPVGSLSSAAGQLPSHGLSWGQAKVLCEAAGRTLATSAQWEDAADGLVGPGGSAYPYGDSFDEQACACLSEQGQPIYPDPLPTGSLPDCVSAFGVYDQSGNLFEWTDPQRDFDVAGWFAGRTDLGRAEDHVTAGSVRALVLDVPGVPRDSLELLEGELTAWAGMGWGWDSGDSSGVLIDEDSGDMLPVLVRPIGEVPGPAWVMVLDRFDGEPMADKRGGSHYSGTITGCRNDQPFLGHLHDFDGSIGFRCVWSP